MPTAAQDTKLKPPLSPLAEQRLVLSYLREPETFSNEIKVRKPEDFDDETLRAIWQSAGSLVESGIVPTLDQVLAGCSKRPEAERLLRRAESRLDLSKEPPREEVRFYLNGVGVASPGDLIAIYGPAKAGKSAVVGAIIASCFAGSDSDVRRDFLGFSATPGDLGGIVHIDTEQRRFDHWRLIATALRRAGLNPNPASTSAFKGRYSQRTR